MCSRDNNQVMFIFLGQTFPQQQPMYDAQAAPQQSNYGFAGQQYVNDPMANVAMQYGQTLADQGKDYVHKNVSSQALSKYWLKIQF